VIEFKEAFLEDKCLYIIMEYASGGDLKRKIKERKGLNLRF
jgi:serine/threonine protein kinase